MKRDVKHAFCFAFGALFLATDPSFASPGAEIAPHRATYEISLLEASNTSRVSSAEGKWGLEVTGNACSGYTVTYQSVTRLIQADGRAELLDTRASSFEAGDGTALEFSNVTYLNNRLVEDTQGNAVRADDLIGLALTKPDRFTREFEGNVLFPAQHLKNILEAADRGDFLHNARVYEGTEGGREAFDVTTTIGRVQSERGDADAPYAVLEQGPFRRWPVQMSYYKSDTNVDGTPDWQNSFLLYENGVSRAFKLEFGEFTLSGRLSSLELLEKEPCT